MPLSELLLNLNDVGRSIRTPPGVVPGKAFGQEFVVESDALTVVALLEGLKGAVAP
jgi:hypothetical protein